METVILVLVGVSLLVNLIMFLQIRKIKKPEQSATISKEDKDEIKQSFTQNVGVISTVLKSQAESSDKVVQNSLESMKSTLKDNSTLLENRLTLMENAQTQRLKDNSTLLETRLSTFENAQTQRLKENSERVEARLVAMENSQAQKMEQIRQTLERNILAMQQSNEQKLAAIQQTVDQKLTETLNSRFKESFAVLQSQLESVTKTVGEMTKMSEEVGSLTRTLTNVKTTGIFGEIQLGAIIEQILAPEQYAKNVVTSDSSRDPVEFVIKLPGVEDGEVLLPVDSKFPYTKYNEIVAAYENNDTVAMEEGKKALVTAIKSMAKDIKQKYICPPKTTNFAIMFLPIEGLYAEVVKLGLVETLQRDFSVTVAGPTTMSALLNSLQMGFQTLAVQKKSADVWNILENVKVEFEKFEKVIENIQKKFNSVNSEFDDLVGKRTRAINRKLRDVEVSPTTSPLSIES